MDSTNNRIDIAVIPSSKCWTAGGAIAGKSSGRLRSMHAFGIAIIKGEQRPMSSALIRELSDDDLDLVSGGRPSERTAIAALGGGVGGFTGSWWGFCGAVAADAATGGE